jgi:hypothetical protein
VGEFPADDAGRKAGQHVARKSAHKVRQRRSAAVKIF